MHRLLKRQLKKAGFSEEMLDEHLNSFIAKVDKAYDDADEDRKLLENSLSISSEEMQQLYQRLKHKAQYEIEVSEARYRRLVENLQKHYFFYIHDNHGHFSYLSDSVQDILGYTKEEYINNRFSFLVKNPINSHIVETNNKTLKGHVSAPYEINVYHKDGRSLFLEISEFPVYGESGEIESIEGVVRDVTNQHLAQDKIISLAHHDDLTGLSNRLDLHQKLNELIAFSKRHRLHFAVLFLDLDHFKQINDTLGHDIGDLLLKNVADRILPNIREEDLFARIGGDEFIIVLTDLNEDCLSGTINKVMELTRSTWKINKYELEISTSIGIAVYPQDGQTHVELMKSADLAMYRAKALGRNNFCFFTEELNAVVHKEMKLEQDMAKALQTDQFVLHLQPIVQTANNVISGAEALIRWQHPELGLVPPNEFIPLAENTGFILKLGDWIIARACEMISRLNQLSEDKIYLSINISTRQFQHGDIVETILDALENNEVDAKYLVLEITESIMADNMEKLIEKIERLKKLGLKISMDDFGTGYSSLSNINRLAIDTLKIDKAFVDEITDEKSQAPLLDTIIAMGQTLGLNVIAEGVESDFQRKYLIDHKCAHYQGYFYSKPVPEASFVELLSASRRS